MGTKVIFLDVDGVLNNVNFSCAFYHLFKTGGYGHPPRAGEKATRQKIRWDFHNVYQLKRIITRVPGTKVVISSSWRIGTTMDTFKRIFEIYGLKPSWVIGMTDEGPGKRGDQIHRWLIENMEVQNVDGYVILDDNDDMLDWQHFVLTDPEVGLQDDDATKAIELLRKPVSINSLPLPRQFTPCG